MQLYTVHGIKNARNINKQEDTYERMMRHVQFLSGNANPVTINIDFERAIINACRTVYPLSLLSGCFFHLSQNIYRKVEENHLSDLYSNDNIFRENIRMVHLLSSRFKV